MGNNEKVTNVLANAEKALKDLNASYILGAVMVTKENENGTKNGFVSLGTDLGPGQLALVIEALCPDKESIIALGITVQRIILNRLGGVSAVKKQGELRPNKS